MNRIDIINYLIEQNGYESYLEIGVDTGECYKKVECKEKYCVDPYESGDNGVYLYPQDVQVPEFLTWRMTSDELFASTDQKFDIIFIDGMHTEEFAGRDIINGLKHLNPGGKIVVHDCIPINYEAQLVPQQKPGGWNGNVWKAITMLKLKGIEFSTVNTDQGCCVIDYFDNPETLTFLDKSPLEYWDLLCNIYSLLNVITPEHFLMKYERNFKIVIVGKAASGKDFLKKQLTKHNKRNVYGIFHTTRPMRNGETEGDDYFYISREKYEYMRENNMFVVSADYNGWGYGLTWEQWYEANVFVFTPEYINSLSKAELSSCCVIYLNTSDELRRERLMERHDADSVERRLAADEEQFEGFTNYDVMIDNLIYNKNGKKKN